MAEQTQGVCITLTKVTGQGSSRRKEKPSSLTMITLWDFFLILNKKEET
jgi:hypothetical protein